MKYRKGVSFKGYVFFITGEKKNLNSRFKENVIG